MRAIKDCWSVGKFRKFVELCACPFNFLGLGFFSFVPRIKGLDQMFSTSTAHEETFQKLDYSGSCKIN